MHNKRDIWITISFCVKTNCTDDKFQTYKKEIGEALNMPFIEIRNTNSNTVIITLLVSVNQCVEIRKKLKEMGSKLKELNFIKSESIHFDFLGVKDSYPDRLYLYRKWNKHTQDIILYNELLLSSPKNFNDPFDCSLRIYENNVSVSNLVEKIGIRCFGRRNDNILMWSHYADEHKGICLAFDTKRLFDYEKEAEFIRVRYRKHYPTYTGIDAIDKKSAVSYKYVDWKYEEEYRLLHGNCNEKMFHFPPSALTQICIGCCMNDKDKADFDEIIAERNRRLIKSAKSEIEVFAMEKDQYEYKLNMNNYPTLK